MPGRRSGSRGRGTSRNANRPVAPRYDDFDDSWLDKIRERQWSRLIDLTSIEDRRRWHPNRLRDAGRTEGPARENIHRPRIVIVPEGHRLARLAPYGGRVPLKRILRDAKYARTRRRFLFDWEESRRTEPRGFKYDSYGPDHISRRVGFQHPWQVMICIRRKRRREVLHALDIAGRRFRSGSGGGGWKRPRRTQFSEVRC